jgi:hypothetical protein
MKLKVATPVAVPRGGSTGARWSRGDMLAVGFATAFLVLFIAPPFTPYVFPPYPLMHWADVIDLVTPLVLIPLYWLLFSASGVPSLRWTLAFLVLAAAWADGHGIHLAANSIGHLAVPGSARDLTEFYDEKLGHYIWHVAVMGLSVLVLLQNRSAAREGHLLAGAAAAAVYGFAFFLIVVEGGTAPLGVPFAVAMTFLGLRIGVRRVLRTPILAVFGSGYAVALLLFAIWFVYWGGRLPQFSEIGLIK